MNVLSLEAHFFISEYKRPGTDDMSQMISLFSEFALMPQYFNELDHATQEKKKMLGFTNPESNQTVFFSSKKILITQKYNPFQEGEGSDEKINAFLEFANATILACGKFIGENQKSNRVSLVGNFTEIAEEPTDDSRLARSIASAVSWCNTPLNEMQLRTGENKTLRNGEELNVLVSVNDGSMEQNKDGVFDQKPCYLVQLDVNTKPGHQEPRFNVESAVENWGMISEVFSHKLNDVDGFFRG